jgi:hypothetical protein
MFAEVLNVRFAKVANFLLCHGQLCKNYGAPKTGGK